MCYAPRLERRLDGLIKFLGHSVGLFSLCSCFSFLQWMLSICSFFYKKERKKGRLWGKYKNSNSSSMGHVECRVNQQGPPCKAKYSWVTNSEVVPWGKGEKNPHGGVGEKTRMVMRGDHIKMVVELVQPVVIEKKMRFAIREGGHTVGAGVVSGLLH